MIKLGHINIAILLIVAFATLFTTESRAAVLEQTIGYDVTDNYTAEHEEITLMACNNNDAALTTNSSTPRILTPEVRTLHSVSRNAERTSSHQMVSTAIDSTTTATRYGLYNHKILFVSIARHHYICRLRRLII